MRMTIFVGGYIELFTHVSSDSNYTPEFHPFIFFNAPIMYKDLAKVINYAKKLLSKLKIIRPNGAVCAVQTLNSGQLYFMCVAWS